MSLPKPFDVPVPSSPTLEAWHRTFAITANNWSWTATDAGAGAEAALELLDAAHAASWHWRAVGTELNRMRALTLLAHVHALVGHGSTAYTWAEEVRQYFGARDDTPDWEQAIVLAIHAGAARAAGASEIHRTSYAAAVAATEAIADEQDRAIVQATLDRVPHPA